MTPVRRRTQWATEWRTSWKRQGGHRSATVVPPSPATGPEDSLTRTSRPAAGAWTSGLSSHSAKTLTVITSPWWSRSGQRRRNRNASGRTDGPSRRRTGRSSRRTVRQLWPTPWRTPSRSRGWLTGSRRPSGQQRSATSLEEPEPTHDRRPSTRAGGGCGGASGSPSGAARGRPCDKRAVDGGEASGGRGGETRNPRPLQGLRHVHPQQTGQPREGPQDPEEVGEERG